MDTNPEVWRMMVGALMILAGAVLALQPQMEGSALPRFVAGFILAVVGFWLLAQANRKKPS